MTNKCHTDDIGNTLTKVCFNLSVMTDEKHTN